MMERNAVGRHHVPGNEYIARRQREPWAKLKLSTSEVQWGEDTVKATSSPHNEARRNAASLVNRCAHVTDSGSNSFKRGTLTTIRGSAVLSRL